MAGGRLPDGAAGGGGGAMTERHSGPAGVAPGAARQAQVSAQATLFALAPQDGEPGELAAGRELGEARKVLALELLRARNPDRVRAAQVALIRFLCVNEEGTVEDLRAALGIPDREPARWLGAVAGELRRAGLIARAGWRETTRAVAHARPVSVWAVRDRAAAQRWLVAHAGGE